MADGSSGALPRPLDPDALARALAGQRLGRRIVYRASATSTSDLAWEAAALGEGEGAVYVAEEQTAGRGRLGRAWHSAPGRGLWLSVLLRPGIEPVRWPLLTVAAALAAAETIEAVAGLPARIRWPNDVLLGERKVAGVLAEARGPGGATGAAATGPSAAAPGAAPAAAGAAVVLGIGVNVSQEIGEFPDELRPLATSLRAAGARRTDRAALFVTLLRALDARYAQVRADDRRTLAPAWRRYSGILGRRVRLLVAGAELDGEVADVEPVDGIPLRRRDGTLKTGRAEHVSRLLLQSPE
ncbi:MAG: biotin--[acetyl-CoA-carboxylase] ligase [Planctomycetes bacterium]|nr:biotin--[acetyl-CoA-carboxylase] ligase [Planctomycetota bacterium]